MSRPFADRLIDAVLAKGTPAVAAIDPTPDLLPPRLRESRGESHRGPAADELGVLAEFARRVIQRVAPLVPAVKINVAYFEPYRAAGVNAYFDLVRLASAQGLVVIGDVKRGDVSHSAAQYARAQLAAGEAADGTAPDAVTVSGYFGLDGVQPFLDVADREGKGVFVLVRTSNPSAGTIQDLALADGRRFHEHLAGEVARWSAEAGRIGTRGYSCVGAVVGTRNAPDARRLRELLPQCILLAPGYGAQGGVVTDFAPYFDGRGLGAIIPAGRSLLSAHANPIYRRLHGDDWEACIERACRDFIEELRPLTAHEKPVVKGAGR